MSRFLIFTSLSLMAVLSCPARAADERERISRERARAEAAYEAQYKDCQSKFVITACVDRAKRQRSETLHELSQRQLVLDDADRRQRAAQRMKQIEEKQEQGDAAQSQASAPAVPLAVKPRHVPQPTSAAASSASPRLLPAAPALSAAQQAQNRADYERRHEEAAQHRAEVEKRERENQAKPVPGLPPQPDIPASVPGRR